MDMRNIKRTNGGIPARIAVFYLLLLMLLPWAQAIAVTSSLDDISFTRQPGDQVQVEMAFSGAVPEPLSFTIANPARITLDFPNTRNNLRRRSQPIQIGAAQSITTAQARDRTRVVINLSRMMKYQTSVQGNKLLLTLAPASASPRYTIEPPVVSASPIATTPEPATVAPTQPIAQPTPRALPGITAIDFRRGPDGAGRVLIKLRDPNTPLDIKQQGSRVIVDLKNTVLPDNLQRHMDVLDFATPVESIDARSIGRNSEIVIKSKGNFSQLAYQSDNIYTVEIRPLKNTRKAKKQKQITYKGERLSLNFQDIEVRSVLQLIADFTQLNVVVSDSVTGNLTLRLKNVPWDQALDIIMKTKGLDKRRQGNVLYIAPAKEIAEREQRELMASKQVAELIPLRTEIIPLNYADAREMVSLLQSSSGSGSGSTGGNSVLSGRGSVTLDRRTNSLLIQDTADKIDEVRALIKTLDVPVRQVMIESRIVTASDKFTREIGVTFGSTNIDTGNNNRLTSDFQVNTPAANVAGSLGFELAKLPLGTKLLDLELSAAEVENSVEVVASPRIITSNKTKARIEQGVEIPYQEATSSGATNTSFKKAVLSMEVTPHITLDDRINLELVVNRDSVGDVFNNIPSIDTREVQTQVLVENGQTIVLGGIFEENKTSGEKRVPFLGDLPVLGRLFRSNSQRNDKTELLIFVTPKIINENLTLQ
jgi:type IV pilus assembly protein PilQ